MTPISPWTRSLPYLAIVAAICGLFLWYLQFLGVGGIHRFDEYYTYERSISFARLNDWWAVYSSNKPTLKKPPMQYWMSGGFMELGLRDLIALRLPSLIFASACLGASALLVRVILPGRPWVMLGAVLLLASSQNLWNEGTSAMLETGSALFVTLGLAAMIAAFRDPRYWPVFALTVFLGGMQKGPIALAFLVFALIGLAITQQSELRRIAWNRRFALWFFGSLILAFAWQLYMGLRFPGEDAVQGSVENEMFERFFPSLDRIAALNLTDIHALVFGDDPWLRLTGTVALIALPLLARDRLLWALTAVALIFTAVMIFGTHEVHARYMIVITPLQAAALACALALILRRDGLALLAAAALTVAFGGPLRPASQLALEANLYDGSTIAEILSPVRANLTPEEHLIICEMDPTKRFPRGAYTVYAADTREYTRMRATDVRRALARANITEGPFRGLCTQAELDTIADQLTGVEVSPLPAGFIQFRAKDLAPE
ncbi:MAG: hypothetical protein AAGK92_07275 [Pseudomonadota bacterium]